MAKIFIPLLALAFFSGCSHKPKTTTHVTRTTGQYYGQESVNYPQDSEPMRYSNQPSSSPAQTTPVWQQILGRVGAGMSTMGTSMAPRPQVRYLCDPQSNLDGTYNCWLQN